MFKYYLMITVLFSFGSGALFALEQDPMQPIVWQKPNKPITTNAPVVESNAKTEVTPVVDSALNTAVKDVVKTRIKPTKRPVKTVVKPKAAKKKQLLLEAISVIGQSKTAIISGQEYYEGDSIGKYRLFKIEFDQVQLSYHLAGDVKNEQGEVTPRIKFLSLHDDTSGIFINPVEY